MNIALVSGLIILVLLIIMLIAGVPIAVALGVSSVCAILPIMDLNVAVLTGCQRIFSGISVFSLLAIPFFILAGNIKTDQSCKINYRTRSWSTCSDKHPCKYVIRFYFRIWYSSGFCYGIYHRTNRERRGI